MITLEQLERAHPALKGFADRYRAEVVPVLLKHQSRLKSGGELVTLGVILGIPGFLLFRGEDVVPLWVRAIGFLMFVVGVGFTIWGAREMSASRAAAKTILVKRVCKLLGFTYHWYPKKTYTRWLHTIGLLPDHETYHAEDEVSGTVDGIGFIFQEVELKAYVIRPGYKGIPERRLETIFQGLIGMIDFHKRFSSTTVAVPNQGFWDKVAGPKLPGQRARLESPRFEERYDVFTTDQVEARYLLTPAFLERLMKLDAFFKGNMEFAFDNGRFLFAAKHQYDWMELREDENIASEQSVAMIILDMTLIYHLIDALKLDAKTKA